MLLPILQLFPGFGGGAPGYQPPPPPPPPPEREDPVVVEARKKQRTSELQRRGRQSTILTKGMEDELGNVTRPQATAVKLFGE